MCLPLARKVPTTPPKFYVIKVLTNKATFYPGQNQNQTRPAHEVSRHCRHELWFLKMSEKGSQRKAIKVGIITCAMCYWTGLTRFAGMVVYHAPHLHRSGFPSYLSIFTGIDYVNSTNARCSDPLNWGFDKGTLFTGSHLLNGSLDISRRVRLEGSLMKDLVCLWDRSALTRNIPSCLVNRSEIWAALHGQYYERNARQFSLGWWAPVLLQYSENLPFEPVFLIAWLSR